MQAEAVSRDGKPTESKRVSISSKRQITIPQKYFTKLGFTNEAECIFSGDELIIRPVKMASNGEFAEQILADLIAQGYSGDELLSRFKETQKKVRPAVRAILSDAEQAAVGKGKYAAYDDIFSREE